MGDKQSQYTRNKLHSIDLNLAIRLYKTSYNHIGVEFITNDFAFINEVEGIISKVNLNTENIDLVAKKITKLLPGVTVSYKSGINI